mmetsp:Transcript_45227/g.118727  ORF Transcript_45227/g.118727 Transcript_45227/m.118727 type:complete len:201 (-) Transcript_45227:186-788(-)
MRSRAHGHWHCRSLTTLAPRRACHCPFARSAKLSVVSLSAATPLVSMRGRRSSSGGKPSAGGDIALLHHLGDGLEGFVDLFEVGSVHVVAHRRRTAVGELAHHPARVAFPHRPHRVLGPVLDRLALDFHLRRVDDGQVELLHRGLACLRALGGAELPLGRLGALGLQLGRRVLRAHQLDKLLGLGRRRLLLTVLHVDEVG